MKDALGIGVSEDVALQEIIHHGVAHSMNHLSMTEEEILALLARNGKAPCNGCTRVHDMEQLGEEGLCNRCICRDCG